MPELHGLEVAKELKAEFPRLSVVIISEQGPLILRRLADHVGIEHVVPKSRLASDLLPLLEKIEAAHRK